MKRKLLEYTAYGLIILWVVAFVWILNVSSQCSETVSITETHGVCLLRRLAYVSCIVGIELAFGAVGGIQAKARNYPFIMGFLLGFFLNFIGAFFVSTLSPRGTYKSPPLPGEKRTKLIALLIIIFLIIFGVLLALRNTGRLSW
jgi:hypothetical protein